MSITGEPFLAKIAGESHALDSSFDFLLEEKQGEVFLKNSAKGTILLPEELKHLAPGDVIRIVPLRKELQVLYKRSSSSNVLFITGNCNNNCRTCPQPPSTKSDDHLFDICMGLIPLISKETEFLGITGGEPTIKPNYLLEVLRLIKKELPLSNIMTLTNGRMFNYLTLARDVASIGSDNMSWGITLFSDLSDVHNQIAGAKYAFDQTIRGILNLHRYKQSIEIRIVILKQNYKRLIQIAKFICRNLPFAGHVAFMGLEPMGYAKKNYRELWIDPEDYSIELFNAIGMLEAFRIPVSIYNIQHCRLIPELRQYAKQSISDWKMEYIEECSRCSMKHECSGIFSSDTINQDGRLKHIPTNTER